MLTLLNSDICRDGGSLVLDYRKDDSTRVCVFLKVAAWTDAGQPRRFTHLYVAPHDPNGEDPSTIVAKGSEAERLLLADIDQLLRDEHVQEQDDAFYHLSQLREYLPGRLGGEDINNPVRIV